MQHVRHRILLSALSAAALCAITLPAHAAGFYLQEQSVSGMGAAYAGTAALGRDPSVLYYNPAGMTQLQGGQIHVGGNYLHARADFKDRGSTLGGGAVGGPDSDDPIAGTIIPNLFYTQQFNDVMWFGVGVSVPFGLSSEFDSTWYGRYDSMESHLETFDIQPSVAFKINNWLSVGGGVDVQVVNAELTSAAFASGAAGRSQLEGDDVSIGWNAGLVLTPAPGTKIGLHYRDSISHKLDGRIKVTEVGAASRVDAAGTAMLDLPSIASIGVAHDVGERWTLLGQVTFFEWSSFQTITAVLDTGTVASSITQDFSDTINYSVGAEYKWNDDITLRAGYQYDETPTNDTYRTTRTPDGDRNWFTGGMTYDIDDRFTLDLSAAYITLDDATIDVRRNGNAARVFVEREDSWIGIGAVGLTYKF